MYTPYSVLLAWPWLCQKKPLERVSQSTSVNRFYAKYSGRRVRQRMHVRRKLPVGVGSISVHRADRAMHATRPTDPSYEFHVLPLNFPASVFYFHFKTARMINTVATSLAHTLFSARQHICYSALYAIARPSVRLSVPLSVTRLDQSKTFEVRITQLSPQSSPMTLVS